MNKRPQPDRNPAEHFEESFVIYWSDDDEAFVAHGLKTDQIGLGDRLVDAMAEGIRAVEAVKQMHSEDSTIQLYRDAPADVRDMVQFAEKLPAEIFEIAYKMVHGTWPANLPVDLSEDESLEDFARRKFTAAFENRESTASLHD